MANKIIYGAMTLLALLLVLFGLWVLFATLGFMASLLAGATFSIKANVIFFGTLFLMLIIGKLFFGDL